MPRARKRARLAQSQRPTGSKSFNSTLVSDIEGLQADPTYIPSDGDEDTDEERADPVCVFSLDEDDVDRGSVTVSGSDSDADIKNGTSECGVDGDNNGSTISSESMASENESGSGEVGQIRRAVRAAREFWDKVLRKIDPVPKATPAKTRFFRTMPTYSGTSRASQFKKKAELKRAAVGCTPLESFFQPHVKKTYPYEPESPSSTSAGPANARSMPETSTEVVLEAATPPQPNSTPDARTAPESYNTSPTPSVLEATPSRVTVDPAPNVTIREETDAGGDTPLAFLATTDEDDRDLERDTGINLRERIAAMMKLAKKHKSATALFKLHMLKEYLDLREKFRANPKIKNPAHRASLAVAKSVGKGPYFARQLRHLKLYVERFGKLPPNRVGLHHAHPSLLHNEQVFTAVRRYLTVLADGEITPAKLATEVNNVIMPNIGLSLGRTKISDDAARRWLAKLGYSRRLVTKGAYVDGHERPDVVVYRDTFLRLIKEHERLREQYDDVSLSPIPPIIFAPGEKRHVPVFQDESIFHVGDMARYAWVRDGRMPLRKKGNGRAIHVSDFIVEETGRLTLSAEQIAHENTLPPEQRLPVFDSREIIYPGKNYDGWWTAERLLAQIRRVIPLFERLYPGCIGDFYFDQSTGHAAFSPDALNAREMNVNPGGQQRIMHATTVPWDNPHPHLRGTRQEMVFPKDLPADHQYFEFRGKPKGMRVVLEERGLWEGLCALNGGKKAVGVCQDCKLSEKARDRRTREAEAARIGIEEEDALWFEDGSDEADIDPVPQSTTCCMRRVLSLQTDFMEEKSMIQQYLEDAGHNCYFLPKFHCEFNPIEMYWGWVKRRFRELTDGTFQTAKHLLPEILDSCDVKTIRAFFRKSWRYMDAYGKGLTARQVEFAVKKYRSHRRIGAAIMMEFAMLDNPA